VKTRLEAVSWPLSRLGEAIEALARRCGLFAGSVQNLTPPLNLAPDNDEAVGRWIDAAAARLGIEAEPIEMPYGEVQRLVAAGPALLRFPAKEGPRFLALIRRRRNAVIILGSDLAEHTVSAELIRSVLCEDLEASIAPTVDRALNEAGIAESDRGRVRAGILQERLTAVWLDGLWLLRLTPGASFWNQMSQAGLPRDLLGLVGAHTTQYLLWLLSWWIVGRGALEGRLDRGWLLAWGLLLLTIVPFRLLTIWSQGLVAIGGGALLKRRLLYGALRLDPEEIRHQGAGQLLGRVIESESVESLALSGGLLGSFAIVELVISMAILKAGAGGWLSVLLLLGWVVASSLIGLRFWRRRRSWTVTRLEMTHELVERMVGHRTRLAQELRERWHEGEDQALEHYLQQSEEMDRAAVWLVALVPRGWLVVGLAGLAPAFVSGDASPGALAVGLGGILLSYGALAKLAYGLSYLADAAISWAQVAALFHAAARPAVTGSPSFAIAAETEPDRSGDGRVMLEAHDLSFRYGDRADAVIKGLDFSVRAGERVLVEGPSGGGKSTLAALLTGLRHPQSGVILLGGLDLQTLGSAGWRRRVVAAPQFHENRVLTETFAFNVLMGRRWPAREADLAEAEAVCRELGLGDLLERMPSGLFQMVGESGWQLSHGERSRLYVARALLQRADVMIFDESFAALDPENLAKALGCVFKRAPTLMVIAHP
jgi:ATP-binding cassette subfamily B protein